MGITSLIGPSSTIQFFAKKSKLLGSAVYFGGMILIIIGYPFFTLIGFLL